MGQRCAEEMQRCQSSLSSSCLCGPEIWGTDEWVCLTSLGVPAIPGGTDSAHHCKSLFAPCSAPCMMWDHPRQGLQGQAPQGSTQTQGRQQNASKSKDVTQDCTLWALQTHTEDDDAGIFQGKVGCQDGMSDMIPVPNPPGACPPPCGLWLFLTIAQQGSPAPLYHIQVPQHNIYMTDTRVHLHSALIPLSNTIPHIQRRRQLQPCSWGQAGRTLKATVQPLGVRVELSAAGTSPQQGCFPKWVMVIHVWFTLWPSFKTFIETISIQPVQGALAPSWPHGGSIWSIEQRSSLKSKFKC